jgi:hypothetical protein
VHARPQPGRSASDFLLQTLKAKQLTRSFKPASQVVSGFGLTGLTMRSFPSENYSCEQPFSTGRQQSYNLPVAYNTALPKKWQRNGYEATEYFVYFGTAINGSTAKAASSAMRVR